jgi:hypothetical protein
MRSNSPIAEKPKRKGRKKDKFGDQSNYTHGIANTTDAGFMNQNANANVVQNVETFKNFLL